MSRAASAQPAKHSLVSVIAFPLGVAQSLDCFCARRAVPAVVFCAGRGRTGCGLRRLGAVIREGNRDLMQARSLFVDGAAEEGDDLRDLRAGAELLRSDA